MAEGGEEEANWPEVDFDSDMACWGSNVASSPEIAAALRLVVAIGGVESQSDLRKTPPRVTVAACKCECDGYDYSHVSTRRCEGKGAAESDSKNDKVRWCGQLQVRRPPSDGKDLRICVGATSHPQARASGPRALPQVYSAALLNAHTMQSQLTRGTGPGTGTGTGSGDEESGGADEAASTRTRSCRRPAVCSCSSLSSSMT